MYNYHTVHIDFNRANPFKNKGFTLIEVLVVISILSVLASIVFTSINDARIKGRDSVRISQIRQVQLALELFYSSNKYYPIANSTNISVNWNTMISLLRSGSYISKAQEILRGESFARSTPIQELASWFDYFPVANAAGAGSTKIQDPLFPSRSYGYMVDAAVPSPQSYRLRTQLEDLSNPLLKNSVSGYFLYYDSDPINQPSFPDEQCAPLSGYYCLQQQYDQGASYAPANHR